MFRGLYETHVVVSDLQVSGSFYENVLGLTPAFKGDTIHVYWIGQAREQMLGLWKFNPQDSKERHVGEPDVSRLDHDHFAFHISFQTFFSTVQTLKERGVRFERFFDDTDEFVVHSWVPAVSAYFSDPDGPR